mgnify:CR=1 FL=1
MKQVGNLVQINSVFSNNKALKYFVFRLPVFGQQFNKE